MKSGICPKCGSKSVYKNSQKRRGDNSYIDISAMLGIRIDNYVCSSCRFSEIYVQESEKIERIMRIWDKV